MKFRGFKSISLKLESIDVKVVASVGVFGLFCCSTCGFTTPRMRAFDCGHVACASCLRTNDSCKSADINAPGPHVLKTDSTCVSCQSTASSVTVELPEAFVAYLLCVCPRCSFKVRLKDLERHLTTCVEEQPTVPSQTLDCENEYRLVGRKISLNAIDRPLGLGSGKLNAFRDDLSMVVCQSLCDFAYSVESLKDSISSLEQAASSSSEVVGAVFSSKCGIGEYRVTLSNKICTNEKSFVFVSSTVANIGGTLFYFVLGDGHLSMVVKRTIDARRLKGRVTALGYTCPCPRNLNEIASDASGVPAAGASLTIGYCDMTRVRHSFRLWVQLDRTC